MKSRDFWRYTVGIGAAAALLAGCGVLPLSLSKGQDDMQPPIGEPGKIPQGRVVATHADRGKSWMRPEARGEDLLYASSLPYSVYVYTYPKGKLVGFLSGFSPRGLCSNENGDVFVASGYDVYEYPHGRAKPIALLADQYPQGCSVDPTTGDLAVVNQYHVAVFPPKHRDRWGIPRTYQPGGILSYCAYDGTGNLFVDAYRSDGWVLWELPNGWKRFKTIALNQSIGEAGNIQWDGTYLAMADEDASTIYQFAISGSTGTEVGATQLNGTNDIGQFWIQGGTVVVPDDGTGTLGFWSYPGGGSAKKKISLSLAYGATVSLARDSSELKGLHSK
ncbi:MAG: hypothetical protein WBW76_09900 [Candidatus Cybelea sp.]